MTTVELAPAGTATERRTGPAPLSETSSITTFGTLAWLGWLWALVVVAFVLTLIGLALWGDPAHSIWEPFGAGWQRWPISGAGFSMVRMFAPVFVVHGITRRRLAQSACVTGIVVACSGALLVVVGFLAERLVYDAHDWSHLGSNDHTIGSRGFATLLAVFVLGHAAYFVSGWLAGLAFNRLGVPRFVVLLPLAALPAAVSELMLAKFGTGTNNLDVLGPLTNGPLWIAAPVTAAVTLAAAVLAGRWTRAITVP